ncbi:Domain of uncharacterised function (DUF2479) [Sebaldella termitidis]|uniref:BppU N-terminal domain-containing protein n=1 Tax=Sebaldella termitidis (strain ATCC 33386 / NCTC 11300) TaxID=526218 RepID=D1AHA8_SEBTE|nr:BppU family phage baseplate upper protein [Sebaldella termitidis]ACZ08142.1 hypothetical protein Sterm_1275 [Sebaldella termitidis ATCC 33386]SUI23444.1 Domain of uncharacterised function (DUF2479) [Sebaldella termitidis]
MRKEYSVDLELFDNIKHTNILYVQGDSEVYPLTINLRKHGMPFDLTGKTATLTVTKMSGAVVVGECEIKDIDGVLVYNFKGNEITEGGKVSVLVQVYEGNKRLTFQEFVFHVKSTKDLNESIKVTDEFNVLTDLIDSVENIGDWKDYKIELED